tara:strand:- start:454 stop:1437 length:984 start_codon:yes stop_codon:yes gene_type:complete
LGQELKRPYCFLKGDKILKIVLNIKELLEEGKINQAEYNKLLSLSKNQTGGLALNLLIGFGIIMVCLGIITITEAASTGVIVGLLTFLIGVFIKFRGTKDWMVLSSCCSISGVLIFLGGMNMWLFEAYESGSDFLPLAINAEILTTFVLIASSVFLMSNILAALSILSIAQITGAGTEYFTASYTIWVSSPLVTIVIFSALAFLLYYLSSSILSRYENILITGSRTSVLVANLGFWVGSIWGGGDLEVSPGLISIVWALALIGFAVWGWRANRRWVVIVSSTFGAIHFYSQWFTILEMEPASVVIGGVIAIGIGIGIKRLDSTMKSK